MEKVRPLLFPAYLIKQAPICPKLVLHCVMVSATLCFLCFNLHPSVNMKPCHLLCKMAGWWPFVPHHQALNVVVYRGDRRWIFFFFFVHYKLTCNGVWWWVVFHSAFCRGCSWLQKPGRWECLLHANLWSLISFILEMEAPFPTIPAWVFNLNKMYNAWRSS